MFLFICVIVCGLEAYLCTFFWFWSVSVYVLLVLKFLLDKNMLIYALLLKMQLSRAVDPLLVTSLSPPGYCACPKPRRVIVCGLEAYLCTFFWFWSVSVYVLLVLKRICAGPHTYVVLHSWYCVAVLSRFKFVMGILLFVNYETMVLTVMVINSININKTNTLTYPLTLTDKSAIGPRIW
jgi:hypothetical protein